jgi:hypothetical protein
VARVVTAFLAVGSILIPVFLLFLVQLSREVMVTIVAVFVTLFMVALCAVVELSEHELFVAVAT